MEAYEYFKGRGISDESQEFWGLYEGTDSLFRGRACIPLRSHRDGCQVAVVGRTLSDEKPKYINSSYDKSRFLFGLFQAEASIRHLGYAVVVEDSISTIVAHQHGLTNVISTLGVSLSIFQTGLIARLCDTIVIAYDDDPGGRKGVTRLIGGFDIDSNRTIKGILSDYNLNIQSRLLERDLDELLLDTDSSLVAERLKPVKEERPLISNRMLEFRRRNC